MMFASQSPSVSVVMPVCNMEPFVADAIRSVLAQTYADFELIIVDDGSSDNSLGVCESFTDRRITILRQAPHSLARARNTGILHARGRYVALIDGDDTWAPNKLAVHVNHLENDEEIGASTSGARLIDASGETLGTRKRPKTGVITARDVFCGNVVLNASAPVFRWEMLIESALPEDVEGRHWVFDERLRRFEDVECWTRLAVTSRFRFETIDQPLTYEREDAAGQSSDVDRQREDWDEACAKIAHIAPDFIADCGAEARAQVLRSLARTCLRTQDGAFGLSLVCEAISDFPALLWQEPGSTATTLLACLAMRLLPQRKFAQAASPALAGFQT